MKISVKIGVKSIEFDASVAELCDLRTKLPRLYDGLFKDYETSDKKLSTHDLLGKKYVSSDE